MSFLGAIIDGAFNGAIKGIHGGVNFAAGGWHYLEEETSAVDTQGNTEGRIRNIVMKILAICAFILLIAVGLSSGVFSNREIFKITSGIDFP